MAHQYDGPTGYSPVVGGESPCPDSDKTMDMDDTDLLAAACAARLGSPVKDPPMTPKELFEDEDMDAEDDMILLLAELESEKLATDTAAQAAELRAEAALKNREIVKLKNRIARSHGTPTGSTTSSKKSGSKKATSQAASSSAATGFSQATLDEISLSRHNVAMNRKKDDDESSRHSRSPRRPNITTPKRPSDGGYPNHGAGRVGTSF